MSEKENGNLKTVAENGNEVGEKENMELKLAFDDVFNVEFREQLSEEMIGSVKGKTEGIEEFINSMKKSLYNYLDNPDKNGGKIGSDKDSSQTKVMIFVKKRISGLDIPKKNKEAIEKILDQEIKSARKKGNNADNENTAGGAGEHKDELSELRKEIHFTVDTINEATNKINDEFLEGDALDKEDNEKANKFLEECRDLIDLCNKENCSPELLEKLQNKFKAAENLYSELVKKYKEEKKEEEKEEELSRPATPEEASEKKMTIDEFKEKYGYLKGANLFNDKEDWIYIKDYDETQEYPVKLIVGEKNTKGKNDYVSLEELDELLKTYKPPEKEKSDPEDPEKSKKPSKEGKKSKKEKVKNKFFKQLHSDVNEGENMRKINKGEFFNDIENEYEIGKYKITERTIKAPGKEEKLTEEEKEEIEDFKKWAKDFWEKVEKESDWNGFSDQQMKDALRIMTEVFLKTSIEEDAEFIKNKAEKLSQEITLNIIREK